jgi:peptidoglycan/xylan/chitin deacetylase (PgdA/CDA1 family)
VKVSELASKLAEGRLERRTVAISFDDGYVDNLLAAHPILAGKGVPATLFASSGYIGKSANFWWDQLELNLLRPADLPPTIALTWRGKPHSWDLGKDRSWHQEDHARSRRWKPFSEPPSLRHQMHDQLWRWLIGSRVEERERLLADLTEQTGASWDPERRPMTWAELQRLLEGDLFEIGSHSVHHPALTALDEVEQARELADSKRQLEEATGRKVAGISYPNGLTDAAIQARAKAAGYTYACGSVQRSVACSDKLFSLPRVTVKDLDAARFRDLMAHYFQL